MGWREQYDRVLRARTRVVEHYAGRTGYETFGGDDFQRFRDDILHCVQDIFHLRDWVKNDQSIDVDLGVLKTLFIGDPVCSPYLHMARDLANGSKHLVLDRARSSEVDVAMSPSGSVHWTQPETWKTELSPKLFKSRSVRAMASPGWTLSNSSTDACKNGTSSCGAKA